MTWPLWQRICAWLATTAGLAWVVKFFVLLATSGDPGAAEPFTAFLLPTIGSVLGFVAAFGIAAPLVAGRGRPVAVLVTAVVGVAGVVVISALSNAVLELGVVEDSDNVVVRTESSALMSGLLLLAVAGWLFTRRSERSGNHDDAEPEQRHH